MKRLKYIYLVGILSVGLFYSNVQAQTLKAFEKAADKAVHADDYYSALKYYKNILEFNESDPKAQYMAADAARKLNAYETAEMYYTQVLSTDEGLSEYPLSRYYLAKMQFLQGNYEAANENYEIFATEYTGNQEEVDMANEELLQSQWAQDMSANQWDEYEVEHLDGSINSPYTDFGAVAVGDDLYYSSLRFDNKVDDYSPARPLSGILVAENMGNPRKADELLMTNEQNIAHTAFNRDMSRMYYTICVYKTSDDLRCDLFYRERGGEKIWGIGMPITQVNDPSYTSTQPNVAYDTLTGSEYLYYVSDRDGGEGGLDIYRIPILENEMFGEPENMSSINTSGDEVTPFYHQRTNYLYFSSNGHKTLGGFDVMKTHLVNDQPTEINVMGAPLNSSYNEIYYSLSPDGETAYMSSNRVGSYYLDEEMKACCYDIYKVNILPFADLIAQTFIQGTSDSLYGTNIQLFDAYGNPVLLSSSEIDGVASATFPLNRDMDYMLVATKQGYIPDTVMFNTRDMNTMEDIVQRLYLSTDVLTLNANTFDADTRAALVGATVTIVDIDNPDAEPIRITNWDGNDFHQTLERGKRYRVIASRKGYKPATVIVDTNDYWDTSVINKDLYLEIGDLDDFLPLVLFFDNDHPNPDTRATTTSLTYGQTYPPYYGKKQEFVDKFTANMPVGPKGTAAQGIDRFFETDLRKGSEDLATFLDVLAAHLRKGEKVNIFLKGYTSPLASTSYNLALGKRRVASVQNHMRSYLGGVLQQYINSGQLAVKEKSFGETTAPKGISDSHRDRRSSVYSVQASKERRVEIVQIQIEK